MVIKLVFMVLDFLFDVLAELLELSLLLFVEVLVLAGGLHLSESTSGITDRSSGSSSASDTVSVSTSHGAHDYSRETGDSSRNTEHSEKWTLSYSSLIFRHKLKLKSNKKRSKTCDVINNASYVSKWIYVRH